MIVFAGETPEGNHFREERTEGGFFRVARNSGEDAMDYADSDGARPCRCSTTQIRIAYTVIYTGYTEIFTGISAPIAGRRNAFLCV